MITIIHLEHIDWTPNLVSWSYIYKAEKIYALYKKNLSLHSKWRARRAKKRRCNYALTHFLRRLVSRSKCSTQNEIRSHIFFHHFRFNLHLFKIKLKKTKGTKWQKLGIFEFALYDFLLFMRRALFTMWFENIKTFKLEKFKNEESFFSKSISRLSKTVPYY